MKDYVVTFRSVVIEEHVVAANSKQETREVFRNGHGRLANRSEIDTGRVVGVRLATENDRENVLANTIDT